MRTLHAVVRGRVHGVGFRAFVERLAEELGLVGWVRNTPDGTVEVEAQGDEAALESLLDALRQGPRLSYVTGVDVIWTEGAAYHSFEMRW